MTDFSKITYGLQNFNALLSSGLTMRREQQAGVDTGTSIMNFGMNTAYGGIRNAMAYDMSQYGNNMGFLVNNLAGYGSNEANMNGTMGLIGASMMSPFTNPFMMNPFGMGGMGMMGGGYMNPMMGGMMGPSVFGGGCGCGGGFMPSMYNMNMRFYG